MTKKTTQSTAPVIMIAGANGHTVILRPKPLNHRASVQIDDAGPQEDIWVRDIAAAVHILLTYPSRQIPDATWSAAEQAMPADKKLRWIPKRPAPITGEDLNKL